MFMKPFNIKIPVKGEEITLTILPADDGIFKIVYYTGILGAVQSTGTPASWSMVPQEELTAGDLPFYRKAPGSDHPEFELDAVTIEEVGKAIDQEQTKNN
jgi:hypothetical protein